MQLISGGASSASTVHNTGRHNLPSKSTRRSTHQEVLLLFVRVKPWLCSTVAQFKCSRGDCSLMFDTEENLTVAFTSKRTLVWPIVLYLIHSRHLSQLETAGRSVAPPHHPLKWRGLGTGAHLDQVIMSVGSRWKIPTRATFAERTRSSRTIMQRRSRM